MKPANIARRVMLASLLAGSAAVSTGCSSGGMSIASMNPFSKPATPATSESSGITATLVSAASGAGQQVSTVGTTLGSKAKNAWQTTSGAVAGIFKSPADEAEKVAATDPLSLTSRPDSISPEVFVANGQLWESTGDFTKAMESYTKALESEASHAPALTSIARLHFRQGKHKQAAEFFQRAITQSPDDAGLHNDLGLTLNKLGDSAGATKSLEKALELAPGTSRYANNLASVKFEAGDSNGAYQVLASNNKPAVAHFNMAYLYFKGGKVDAAREHLGQVMKYEAQAAADPAIQRAIERSRDMIAQISAATGPIAQAAPQASIAAGNQLNAEKTIRQASQSTTPTTGVSPAASILPANLGYQIPGPASTKQAAPKSDAVGTGQPQAIPSQSPETSATSVSPTRPMPTKPTMERDANEDAVSPTNPFSLPDGFGTK